jgi:transcriptional regulator with XRE-family HTH domain
MAKSEPSREATSFAARLKMLREGAGLTQAQLAERAGLHLGAVFKLEQGRREPSWATVQALCDALGVSCEKFRTDGETGGKRPPPAGPTPKTGDATPSRRPTRRKPKGG